jgi:glycosyltransferase involved in cell wall biosynthesis
MKVILSTGQGRLHFMQVAVYLKRAGLQIKVITGWIPGKFFPDKIINILGKLAGRKDNLANGLRKRTPSGLTLAELKSCGTSEFILQLLFKLSSYRLLKRADSAVFGWRIFGRQSCLYIKDADIFHVRSGAGCGGAIKKARKAGMKVVVDHSIAHPKELERQLLKSAKRGGEVYNKYLATSPSDKFWNLVLEDCLNADCLLVNSEYVKWSFINEGYPADKIRVVQWGVNPEFDSLKLSYSASGPIRLIFTGGFGSRKGATLIINALRILKDRNIEFTFDVVGSVMSDITIPDWFNETASIKLHGHLPQKEMKPLLEQSDIYIFPTYTEGSAQSVKEAMAIGLPVITTMQSGAPIEHGENGLLIEDDNVDSLVSTIINLGGNRALQEKLGRNAASTIRKAHTWDNFAKEVSGIYRELITK